MHYFVSNILSGTVGLLWYSFGMLGDYIAFFNLPLTFGVNKAIEIYHQ